MDESYGNGKGQIHDFISKGRQIVTMQAGTATLSNVASSATNVTVLAANTARKGATIVNDSTQILYLKFFLAEKDEELHCADCFFKNPIYFYLMSPLIILMQKLLRG